MRRSFRTKATSKARVKAAATPSNIRKGILLPAAGRPVSGAAGPSVAAGDASALANDAISVGGGVDRPPAALVGAAAAAAGVGVAAGAAVGGAAVGVGGKVGGGVAVGVGIGVAAESPLSPCDWLTPLAYPEGLAGPAGP